MENEPFKHFRFVWFLEKLRENVRKRKWRGKVHRKEK